MPKLRQIDLHSLNEVTDEITRLRAQGYSQGGQWNLTQLCEHLTGTIRIGLHGTMKPLPWIVRVTFGNLVFWLLTSRIIRGFTGVKTLASLEPAEHPADDAEVIERCLAMHREAQEIRELRHTYPLATNVSVDRWKTMMTVHAQHHLEFLKPRDS